MKIEESVNIGKVEERTGLGAVLAADQELAREQQAAGERARAVQRRSQAIRLAIRVASLIVVLGGWEYFGRQTNPVLFTYPTAVANAAVKMIASGELWKYLSQSLIVLFAGLGLAAVFGIALGLIMARVWVVDLALDTYITALDSIPSVALVPVLVLWFGFETTAKIAVVFLFTFFPIVINTYQGVKNVDDRLLEVGRAFRCSERDLWTHIDIAAPGLAVRDYFLQDHPAQAGENGGSDNGQKHGFRFLSHKHMLLTGQVGDHSVVAGHAGRGRLSPDSRTLGRSRLPEGRVHTPPPECGRTHRGR